MSIQFTCPKCGATKSVEESFAGQSGPCANCGATVTVPARSGQAGRKSSGAMVILIVLIACAALCVPCAAVGVALLLPAVQVSREAARVTQCQNNLKQIALALHSYEMTYRTLPPAYLADENGQPMHSWRVLILPFLERQDLYQQYNFNEPWDSASNSALQVDTPPIYNCPSSSPGGCSYFVLNVPDGIFDGTKGNSIGSITDGTSNTIMVVEAVGRPGAWTDPNNDLDSNALRTMINGTQDGNDISSRHRNGAVVAFADGSVHLLTEDMAEEILQAMATKSGGEAVQLP